jgi:hypothetical protein
MDEKRVSIAALLSMIGAFAIGISGFCAGALAVVNEYDYVGAGLCFLAAAFSFGLLANALYRK